MKDITYKNIHSFLKENEGRLGAITITGGEPTLHFWKLIGLLKLIKIFNYKVKLDTNGTLDPVLFDYLLNQGYIDYIAMDIKSSFDNYHKVTPANFEKTLQYLKNIKSNIKNLIRNAEAYNYKYEFRTTASKIVMNKNDFIKISNFLCDIRKEFNMIQYNKRLDKYSIQKIQLDKNNIRKYKNVNFKDEDLKDFAELLSEHFETVTIR